MLSPLCRLSLLALLAAGVSSATQIAAVEIQIGSWTGTSFIPTGACWNTDGSSDCWALGVAPPDRSPTIMYTSETADLSLPFAEYFLYMADPGVTGVGALQIALTLEGGGSQTAVFTSSDVVNAGPYTPVSSSNISLSLLFGPQSGDEQVGAGGNPQTYSSDGTSNWLLDALLVPSSDTPEPGTWALLAAGLGVLFAVERHRRRQAA